MRLCLVSARLPIHHHESEGWQRAPGGLVSALESTASTIPSTWFGRAPEDLPVPERALGCDLAPVRVPEESYRAAVDGYCNRSLWPALHGLPHHVEEHPDWWRQYLALNDRTATVVAERAEHGAFVWVHDFHYFGLATPLRRIRPDLRLALFCHTPVVRRSLSMLRHASQLRSRLCDFELIGCQTAQDAGQLEAWLTAATSPGERTIVMSDPVGFDVDRWLGFRADDAVEALARRHRRPGGVLAVGADRVDYTKGLLHKLLAIELVLTRGSIHPDEFRLVQVAVPSRTGIPVYAYLDEQVAETADRICAAHRRSDGLPVVQLIRRQLPPREVAGLMRGADVGLITPARDGMNLVALEFSVLNGDRAVDVVLGHGAGAAAHIGRWSDLVDGTDVLSIADAIDLTVHRPRDASGFDRSRRRSEAASRLTSQRWADAFLAQFRMPHHRESSFDTTTIDTRTIDTRTIDTRTIDTTTTVARTTVA